MRKACLQILVAALVIAALANLVLSVACLGCASPPPRENPALAFKGPKHARFSANIAFLKSPDATVAEVYASLGAPDWESHPLRLMAYRAQNNQSLFVTYGTNNVVIRHAVKRIPATDSLADAAVTWLKSN